jgi:immune inhibitor A
MSRAAVTRLWRGRRMLVVLGVVLGAALPLGALGVGAVAAAGSGQQYALGNWKIYEDVDAQPTCATVGYDKRMLRRQDCAFGQVTLTPAAAKPVKVDLIDSTGTVVSSQTVTANSTGVAQFDVFPAQNWAPGTVTIRATVAAPDTGSGQETFVLNPLGVDFAAAKAVVKPGEAIDFSGTVSELDSVTCCVDNTTPVPATVRVKLVKPDGTQVGGSVTATADSNGKFAGAFPGSATAAIQPGADSDYKLKLGLEATATYDDTTPFVSASVPPAPSTSGAWSGSGSAPVTLRASAPALQLENSFVSSTGWVKPGESYPFRLILTNSTDEWQDNVAITVPAPSGVVFKSARALKKAGTVTVTASSISWKLSSIATGTTATLVVDARAKKAGEDSRIVWKDLSSTATLTYDGQTAAVTATSHGPKVIPPVGGFETARYGDKPFPVIPVDFRDRKHKAARNGEKVSTVINSPDYAGSTFNLYQEMSYGQLFPIGDIPSADIATAKFDYGPGFDFSERDLKKPTCRGLSLGNQTSLYGTPLYPDRISDGWYQLPGDTEYYGGDYPAFTATPSGIDAACGDTSKLVYDAVQIADPEINYNDFDTDKDGVVDFVMVLFAGCGGNGGSQLGPVLCEDGVPYDNPWPHSSSLEGSWSDPVTGLPGYTSDDQLTDLEGTPQCFTSTTYAEHADCAANGGTGKDDLPVYVRVGPYNINPETAVDHASVISHEYGHHLGLPDYYSTAGSVYADLNLMASDYSQHMTVFSKQELGWVVPQFLQPGQSLNVNNWSEIKNDTGTITWKTPSGQPYTLSKANGDQNVHNGQVYGLKLPHRLVIDPQKVASQASAPYVYWSGRGDGFGCVPDGGHNLDIALPELANLPANTPVTLTFKSSWDMEWDFDYGFVMTTTDGTNYTSLASAKNYTTPIAVNPNDIGCQGTYGNGLTGTSGSAGAGLAQQQADRANATYAAGSPFIDDQYDLTSLAGHENAAVRFSYSTDPGVDRAGWFIDDVVIKAGDQVIYSSDFTNDDDLHEFPGGCSASGARTADRCTEGWSRIKADTPTSLDHGYYIELRDRSGFDYASHGQADRGSLAWEPGVLVEYTDEARGYGNFSAIDPPRQHYIDSQPDPGYDCGGGDYETDPEPAVLPPDRCEDVAFTAQAGDNHFKDVGWVDNFHDAGSTDGLWHFDYGCLTLDVLSMSGNTNNSEALPSDLTANAKITAGSGCDPFDYWAGVKNAAPTATLSYSPRTPGAGDAVTFDSAGTFDDLQEPGQLSYKWTFGDGSTATGAKAMHAYAARGTYDVTLTATDANGASGTDTAKVTVSGPDLQVSDVSVSTASPKQGETVTVSATVLNAGPGKAAASKTELLLDGTTVLGLVDTPALAAGKSAKVSVSWSTKKVKGGDHVIKATADKPAAIAEENEANNAAQRTVTVKGNKVANGDFEQQSTGGQPDGWTAQSTSAGTASSSSTGGTDGSHAAQAQGTGGNAALAGSPTWTSAPIDLTGGQAYDLTAAIKATGLSSAPSVALTYLNATGAVLSTVTVLTAPLSTSGFTTLEKTVTAPLGAAKVRVTLTAFAPTDFATAGTVTFDDVGLFAH